MAFEESRFMQDPAGRIADCLDALLCLSRSFPSTDTDPAFEHYSTQFATWMRSLLKAEWLVTPMLKAAESEGISAAGLALRLLRMHAALRATLAQKQLLMCANHELFWEFAEAGEAVAAHSLLVQMQETMSAINEAMRDNPLAGSIDLD